jgi:hypothetical protein
VYNIDKHFKKGLAFALFVFIHTFNNSAKSGKLCVGRAFHKEGKLLCIYVGARFLMLFIKPKKTKIRLLTSDHVIGDLHLAHNLQAREDFLYMYMYIYTNMHACAH